MCKKECQGTCEEKVIYMRFVYHVRIKEVLKNEILQVWNTITYTACFKNLYQTSLKFAALLSFNCVLIFQKTIECREISKEITLLILSVLLIKKYTLNSWKFNYVDKTSFRFSFHIFSAETCNIFYLKADTRRCIFVIKYRFHNILMEEWDWMIMREIFK